jgi:phenylacetic acid degradation protein
MNLSPPRVYAFEGLIPVVEPGTFIHPTAVLIGDVLIGAGCYIGPGASLRGDFGRLIVMAGSNIQDGCVMHGFPGTDTVVEENGHIGHGAVLHGCTVRRNVMVGMNAVIMDDVEIGESSIVAASSFVKAGMQIPPRTLVAGVPGRIVRELSEAEVARKTRGTQTYQKLAQRCLAGMSQATALTRADALRLQLRTRWKKQQ